MNSFIEIYFKNLSQWNVELATLRNVILECGLKEEYKWRTPCYTSQGKNIVLLAFTKHFFSLSFLKGELLSDKNNILIKAGPNSRSAMYMKFTCLKDIEYQKETIKAYIKEAIQVELNGSKKNTNMQIHLELPAELIEKFENNIEFKTAFSNLSKGRQRGYVIYFSGAKQSKTRTNRIDKYTNRILNGKGMLDCVCGLSKRMPNCDGSHKQVQ